MLIPFEFDGVKSSVYGLYVCSFDGGSNGAKTLGNEITTNTVKTPSGKRWMHTGCTYESPLTFTFQIAKYECGEGVTAVEPRELARIMRWLVRREYHYLRFEQNGWDNVFYNCTLKVQKYEIGGVIRGFEIEATCDAPWGYSEPKEYTTKTPLNENSEFKIYNYSDEDGGLLPDIVQINVRKKCDLRITNTFLTKNGVEKTTKTEIKNCKAGEILQFDRHRNIQTTLQSSNAHEKLMDDFNHVFLELFSDLENSKNTITVKDITANTDVNSKNNSDSDICDLYIRYREIRKGVPV